MDGLPGRVANKIRHRADARNCNYKRHLGHRQGARAQKRKLTPVMSFATGAPRRPECLFVSNANLISLGDLLIDIGELAIRTGALHGPKDFLRKLNVTHWRR